jgi:hypothetical protein
MIRPILGLLLVLTVLGCKSRPLGPYSSPRVIGRVFAADTGTALVGVTVIRGANVQKASSLKGAELLIQKPPVRTDENGRFELPRERVLSIVRGADWNIVSIAFESPGYQAFETNCLTSTLTNSTAGETVLDMGNIYLQPLHKLSSNEEE